MASNGKFFCGHKMNEAHLACIRFLVSIRRRCSLLIYIHHLLGNAASFSGFHIIDVHPLPFRSRYFPDVGPVIIKFSPDLTCYSGSIFRIESRVQAAFFGSNGGGNRSFFSVKRSENTPVFPSLCSKVCPPFGIKRVAQV